MKDFLTQIERHYTGNNPFVVFSTPKNNVLQAYLQIEDVSQLKPFSKKGFVFAPFSEAQTTYAIHEAESEVLETAVPKKKIKTRVTVFPETKEEYDRHTAMVSLALATIKEGNAEKIVVSRKKLLQLKDFDLKKVMMRLFSLYPAAFCYVWFHPETGLWCGATPETLLNVNEQEFTTMALAGTMVAKTGKVLQWTQKERDEQQIVTDAIVKALAPHTETLETSNTYNHRAGNLTHLRTDITGRLKKNAASLQHVAAALHPTPAVCGLPTESAKRFINAVEKYDRKFYTGYLGLVCPSQNEAQLFVNLRCMQLTEANATLFVGGGITEASKPEAEWEETRNKLQTMLQVLIPML